jgi:prepilin-type N-terminal cleavage/methylation domain-containing protein
MKTRPRKKQFSLMELLIVIAIISILAALLFPALVRARRKTLEISCLSNLKQMGLASMEYMNDYDEFVPISKFLFPDPGGSGNDEVSFMNYFYNNGINSRDVFTCPVLTTDEMWEPLKYEPGSTYGVNNLPYGSYIIPSITTWTGVPGSPYPYGITAQNQIGSWTGASATMPIPVSKVRDISQKIYIVDAIRKPKTYTGTAFHWASDMESLAKWAETDHGPVPVTSGTDCRDVGNHHLNGAFNVLYGDMHGGRCVISQRDEWIVYKK